MIVLIDDERDFIDASRIDDVMIFRNSHDAVDWLSNLDKNTVIEQLWFDHDLGMMDDGSLDSIIPVLRLLEEFCFFDNSLNIKKIIVHTSNRVGGDEIEKSMRRYYPTIRVQAGDYLIVR